MVGLGLLFDRSAWSHASSSLYLFRLDEPGSFVGEDVALQIDRRPIKKRHYSEKLAEWQKIMEARNVGSSATKTPRPTGRAAHQRSYTEIGAGGGGGEPSSAHKKRHTDGDVDADNFFLCDDMTDDGEIVPSPVPVAPVTPRVNVPFDQQQDLGCVEDGGSP